MPETDWIDHLTPEETTRLPGQMVAMATKPSAPSPGWLARERAQKQREVQVLESLWALLDHWYHLPEVDRERQAYSCLREVAFGLHGGLLVAPCAAPAAPTQLGREIAAPEGRKLSDSRGDLGSAGHEE